MENNFPKCLHSRFRPFAGIAAGLAVFIGVLVLAGWTWDIDRFKRVLPGLVSMNPITAVLFVLAGISLWLQRHMPLMVARASFLSTYRCAQCCAIVVLCMGLLRLASYAFGWEFRIDQVLFAQRLAADTPGFSNRMSPNTALNFVFIGMALLLLDMKTLRGRRPTEFLAIAAALISLLALIGYAYRVQWLYGIATFIPMALHTAVVFQLLALGILCARCDAGLMALVASESPGGALARRLLPAMVLIPFLLGWLCLRGERSGIYGSGLSITLYAIANIVIFGVLVLWSARSLQSADAELQERAAQLEEANKELESFSYSISHDLRAPLRHVQGYVEMLIKASDGQLSEKARRYLQTITDASTEMGQLIDDLLAFSRMSRIELCESCGNLDGFVQDAIKGLEMATRGRNIVWKIAPLPRAQGDPSLLKQVFANLIGNAVKYSSERDPAEIEVGCTGEEDGRLIFFVKDNGAGFDMKYADKLFGVFQRLHPVDEFEGTGIGLAIVKRIIVRHGGRTWAEGKVGDGATFYFTLKPAEKG